MDEPTGGGAQVVIEALLRSFPALSRDVCQSFYSLAPKRREESALSVQARKFNVPIRDHISQSEDFPTLKSVCEGRKPPAYEAASEFIAQAANDLDQLLADIGGKKNSLSTPEKLEHTEAKAQKELGRSFWNGCSGAKRPTCSWSSRLSPLPTRPKASSDRLRQ